MLTILSPSPIAILLDITHMNSFSPQESIQHFPSFVLLAFCPNPNTRVIVKIEEANTENSLSKPYRPTFPISFSEVIMLS